MAQQLHEIHALRPKGILEIGIGNGFTSTFLRRAGYQVTTVDINPDLEPDICAPLDEVSDRLGARSFDLVVCCEVLEHMPYDVFAPSLDHLRRMGDRLFLTLPNYRASIGFGGFLQLPKIAPRLLNMFIEIPRPKRLDGEHFWEVGSSRETSKDAIMRELRRRYDSVDTKGFALNPYHISFVGS
jgi:SAM-dependent methyltransferase